MDLELTGKRALVTGGSRGIGKAVARQLATEGAAVAIVARDEQALAAAARELSAETGGTVVWAGVDTAQDASVRTMVAEVVEQLGGLDILVNCAASPGGGGPPPKLEEIDDPTFFDDVNVKVMGYLRCAREAAPHLREHGWGRIINISGLGARRTGSTVGSMRNVAVAALTKSLSDELGPDGINVTVVHPAMTWTERMPGVVAGRAEASGKSEEEILAQLAAGNVLGRIITAEEVADVVTFLASPRSVAVNGDAVPVGGGIPKAIYY